MLDFSGSHLEPLVENCNNVAATVLELSSAVRFFDTVLCSSGSSQKPSSLFLEPSDLILSLKFFCAELLLKTSSLPVLQTHDVPIV